MNFNDFSLQLWRGQLEEAEQRAAARPKVSLNEKKEHLSAGGAGMEEEGEVALTSPAANSARAGGGATEGGVVGGRVAPTNYSSSQSHKRLILWARDRWVFMGLSS